MIYNSWNILASAKKHSENGNFPGYRIPGN